MTWRVTCDGSAITPNLPKGVRHPGGWAAVVEHGSDGWVVRGAVPLTTSTRMEITAALRGLREVPGGADVEVVSDCTVVWSIHDRWLRRVLVQGDPRALPRDLALWQELAAEFDRLGQVTVSDVDRRKGAQNPVHRRCHVIAQAEARSLAVKLGITGAHLPREEQERRAAARRARKQRFAHRERLSIAAAARALDSKPFHTIGDVAAIPHRKHCRPGRCVTECIHYGRGDGAASLSRTA